MNPFEKKAHEKRMHELIAERDDLIKQLRDQRSELSALRMQSEVWEAIAQQNKSLEKSNADLTNRMCESYKEGYNQAVWDVTQFLTDKQKEPQP